MAKRTCSIEACSKPIQIRGWCSMHYSRWKRHGDPLVCRGVAKHSDPRVRFMEQVVVDASGCWLWCGPTDPNGYGTLHVDDIPAPRKAHRIAYEWFVGPIPEGKEIDHVWANGCRNRHCVNWVDHLEPVTPLENKLRAVASKPIPVECSEGHALTPDNVYVRPGNGRRVCRKCGSLNQKWLRTIKEEGRVKTYRARTSVPLPVWEAFCAQAEDERLSPTLLLRRVVENYLASASPPSSPPTP